MTEISMKRSTRNTTWASSKYHLASEWYWPYDRVMKSKHHLGETANQTEKSKIRSTPNRTWAFSKEHLGREW